MLNAIVTQVTPQVKTTRITMPSRQELLTEKLAHELRQAVLFNRNAATVEVDGKKFTCQATMSTYDRDYNLYHVVAAEVEKVDPYAPSKRYSTLSEARKDLFKSTRKVIKSGAVLRTVFSSRQGSVVAVDKQSEVVESFVMEVCKQLGWPYTSPRKQAFESRVNVLRGEIEQGIN